MERQLHIWMALVHGRFKKIVFKEAFSAGLHPGQPKVLEYIFAHEGCAQWEICAAWDVDKSTMSGLIERMERDGLIRCEKEEGDRRKKAVYLTEQAKRIWLPIQKKVEEMERAAWQGIDPARRQAFLETLAQIHENLKRLEGSDADERQE